MSRKKSKLRVNDEVQVMSGAHKNEKGKILKLDRDNNKVWIEGVNLVKKTIKPKNPQEKGGIEQKLMPIQTSNVMYVSKNGPSKIGYRIENSKKVRFAKKTNEVI